MLFLKQSKESPIKGLETIQIQQTNWKRLRKYMNETNANSWQWYFQYNTVDMLVTKKMKKYKQKKRNIII